MSKFFDVRNLIEKATDAQFYMSIGERSNGKTNALDKYVKDDGRRISEKSGQPDRGENNA